MRWLVLKDLRILRRSPLLVALLVLYPVVLAVLIGLALSAGPSKPRVAVANLVPTGQSTFSVGGRTLDAADYASRLFRSIDPIRVHTRQEAIDKVRSGEALGALVLPADAAQRLRGALGLSGGAPPPGCRTGTRRASRSSRCRASPAWRRRTSTSQSRSSPRSARPCACARR